LAKLLIVGAEQTGDGVGDGVGDTVFDGVIVALGVTDGDTGSAHVNLT